jgi:hypothetical protein
LALDYSDDGMVWQLGGTIPIRDCTKSGSSPIAGQHIKYVRMNLNSLSPTAAINATYIGFIQNPGPTGTVTSVFGRTGDVLAQPGDYNVTDVTGAAGLFSPNFTGSPTAPTPSPGDNSTRIATTAFVDAIFATCCNGGGPGGGAVTSVFGRTGVIAAQAGDYSVSQVTGAAGLASPAFTGTPTGPTAAVGTNTTQLATTAFVLANAGAGGSGLTGCATPSAGNLVCDVSVQGGIGTVGLLTLPYASGGLPSPPSTAQAAIAADATGHLFWSPGNNTAFAAIGGAGGTTPPPAGVATFNGRSGAVMPQASDYSAFFAPIGTSTTAPATALQFAQSVFDLSATAPINGECLAVNGTTVVGAPCGGGGAGAVGGVTIIP